MAEKLLLEKLEQYIKQRWIPQPEPAEQANAEYCGSGSYNAFDAMPERSMPSEPFAGSAPAPAKNIAPIPAKSIEPLPAKKRRSFFPSFSSSRLSKEAPQSSSLDERLKYLDESFSQMLLRKIDEAGIKDSECYNRAQLNRALFNKIKNDPAYRTSKETAVALGLALRLQKPEFTELLSKAGYSLSRSSKFDVIIEFCLDNSIFSIMEVNELLFIHDQNLLGAK